VGTLRGATGQFDPEVHGEIDLILNRAEALSVGFTRRPGFPWTCEIASNFLGARSILLRSRMSSAAASMLER
jgi:hypothetical protein